MTIYNVIEDLCNQQGLSINALSRKIDLDDRTIRKWKSETSSPRVCNLKKVADYFGLKVDDLLPDTTA